MHGILSELRDASILTYRSYNKSYRIWEGSDVDIEERIAEGERKTQQALSLADSVRQHITSRPMVARRHSFETGALRMFEVAYVDALDALEHELNTSPAMDGKIIVCLAEATSLEDQFRTRAARADVTANLLLAIPQQIGELRGIVTELAALRWVWSNTPELRDDRVARREVSLRITEAEQLLLRNLNGLVDPRGEPYGSNCLWFHAGLEQMVSTPADVSQLLSNVCEQFFEKSPRIRNELIVRRALSSAAAAARRNLIERMLQCDEAPTLGIEGYPPERSMYESVLRATGIHRQQKDGCWGIHAPSRSRSHNLAPSWNHLSNLIFKQQPEPVPLDALFAELSSPPYGILDGLHPVLLCAFLLVHSNETTLYRDGTFLPEPGIADFEVILRRPELYAIAGCQVSGSRKAVVQRLASSLKVEPATVPVVRALFRMVKALPDFAWNTRRLPPTTLSLRHAFQNAQSPERFLFVAVPEALGLPAFSSRKPKDAQTRAFFKALNENLQQWSAATLRVVDEARDTILEACGVCHGNQGWDSLREKALRIESGVTDSHLLAFVRRLLQGSAGREGVESVCALVANRPPANWTDSDVERFPGAAEAVGQKFRKAAAAASSSRTSARAMSALNGTKQKQAERLLRDLRAVVARSAKKDSIEVVRAAVTQLLRECEMPSDL